LFSPHNEHRIFFTRIFNLIIYEILNGWDPKSGMYIQAILPSIIAIILTNFINLYISKIKYLIFHYLLIFIVIGSPYYWENILWSFQNQFYFMALFGITFHILYIKRFSIFTLISIGILQLFILFTVASGVLAIISSIFLTLIKLIQINNKKKIYWFFLLFYQIILIMLQSNLWVKVPHHEQLKASSFNDFFNEFLHVLSWPFNTFNEGYIYVWGILILIIFYQMNFIYTYKKNILSNNSYFFVGIALLIWAFFQEIAVSFSRTYANVYSSRYLLTYGFVLIFISQYFFIIFKTKLKLLKIINIIPLFFSIGVIGYNINVSKHEIIERYNFLNESRKNVIYFYNSKINDEKYISEFICPSQLHVKNIIELNILKNKLLWLKNN
jgi:hypothetical protein